MNFENASFVRSVYSTRDLPPPSLPEIAFAGRSNVGKSSLINRLLNRRNLVKTSSRPGRTQCLNFFSIDERLIFVDLPGYGFARVSRQTREAWQRLINAYLEERPTLVCVVVIIDLRHELKEQDRSLVEWLRYHGIPFVPVYTKADKLSANRQRRQAASLDAGLNVPAGERVLFSARTGQGVPQLQSLLASFVQR